MKVKQEVIQEAIISMLIVKMEPIEEQVSYLSKKFKNIK